MRIRIRWALGFAGMALLLGLCGSPLLGQSPTVVSYPDFVPTPEYEAAVQLVERTGSQRQEGVQALLRLADQNPHSTLGATCLFKASSWCENKATGLAIYQRIVQEYPNSRFSIQAEHDLAAQQAATWDAYMNSCNSILRKYQAPLPSEIIANPSRSIQQVRSLPLEVQHGLSALYVYIGFQLEQTHEFFQERSAIGYLGQALFTDDAGALIDYSNLCYSSRKQFKLAQGSQDWGQAPPRVKLRSPHSRCGSRPSIRIESTCRGRLAERTYQRRALFLLDGVDVTAQVSIVSFRFNPQAQKNQILEQLLYEYRPPADLSQGHHTFSGAITTGDDPRKTSESGDKSGITRFSHRFEVRHGERDRDDPRDNDHWEEND